MQCPECGHTPKPEDNADPARCPECGIYYHKALARRLREAEALNAKPAPKARPGVSKIPLLLLGCVVIVVGLGFGWVKYQEGKAIEMAKPGIKIATAYVMQQLGYHGESTNVTFAEYFEKAKLGVDEIDKEIIRLTSADAGYGEEDLALALEYMRASRDTLRDMSRLMRANMSISIAEKAVSRAREEKLENSNPYMYEALKKSELRALDEQLEELTKLAEANESLKKNAVQLLDVRSRAAARFGEDLTVPASKLSSLKVNE